VCVCFESHEQFFSNLATVTITPSRLRNVSITLVKTLGVNRFVQVTVHKGKLTKVCMFTLKWVGIGSVRQVYFLLFFFILPFIDFASLFV
jgi:hypothetical protein